MSAIAQNNQVCSLVPDTKEAVRFLSVFRPGGPWVLTAIPDTGKATDTQTFTDLVTAEPWIADRNNNNFNIYFCVNPAMGPLLSKAAKTHMRGLAFLHVDVDPRIDTGNSGPNVDQARAQKHLDEERGRIRNLLFNFDPPPTFIVDSGGGYQAYWRLDTEQPINGDVAKAVVLEAYNVQLELLLGADSCHDVCRILRVPSTINWPNETKRKKGRVPALAMVVLEKPHVYPLNTFTPAQRGGRNNATGTVRISPNLSSVDLNDLPPGVSLRMQAIIVQGDDPVRPYKSQSEAVFAVTCEMVRAGCSDDQIAAVLLDKDNGVSQHIYRQNRPTSYVGRQIKRAKDFGVRQIKTPELTDVGNALRLAQAHSNDLLYCYAKKTWLHYKDGHWREDDGALIARYCKDVVQAIRKEAADIYDSISGADSDEARTAKEDRANKLLAFALTSSKKERIFAIETLARSELPVDPADLDADIWLFNVLNCTIDLRTGQQRPHDSGDLLCLQADVEYQPDAQCPMFMSFLERILPDAELRHFMQKAAGYSLAGDISEQVVFFAYGGGENGKSTLFKILRAASGGYHHTAQMEAFIRRDRPNGGGPNEELASMVGKRLVLAAETEEGTALDEQLIKQVTGGEMLRARFLHQNSFEFMPQLKLWLQVNHLPRISGTDRGIWRRIRVVPFKQIISEKEKDKTLAEKIIASELPGVLQWLIEGSLMVQSEGLGTCRSVNEETAYYRKEEDVLRTFFEDRCSTAADFLVPVALVRDQYYAWCREHGEKPMTNRKLSNEIVKRGYPSESKKYQSVQQRCYVGFRLLTIADLALVGAHADDTQAHDGTDTFPF